MKNIVIGFALLFSSYVLAQIGEVRKPEEILFLGEKVNLFGKYGVNGKVFIAYQKSSCIGEKGCLYALTFQNQEYDQIEDLQIAYFYAKQEELAYLFNEMRGVFKRQEDIVIPVGGNNIRVSYENKIDKTITVILSGNANGFFEINAAGLYYLFGKKQEWNKKSWKAYLKSEN